MLHTYVGASTDEVRELVREPMTEYLRSSMSLVKSVISEWAPFAAKGEKQVSGDEFEKMSESDAEDLLSFAFERYFATSGLFGSVDDCVQTAEKLRSIGVDEIACLIDFGVDTDKVIEQFDRLREVKDRVKARQASVGTFGLAEQMARYGVTHLQCTPSQARLLLHDPSTRAGLGQLEVMMVGGEALGEDLVDDLRGTLNGRLLNMYGPTETTIWSTTYEVTGPVADTAPLGPPIRNTQLYVLDRFRKPVPIGAVGELHIGGESVARGYFNRDQLTSERFIENPFADGDGSPRLYRTGDLVRYQADGTLQFVGRADFQVKIRGHRIELGEIEAVFSRHPSVRQAVVVPHDLSGSAEIVAYVQKVQGAPEDVDLVAYASGLLPDFMVPSVVMEVEAFPMTPNGKVDRKAFPAPKRVRAATDADEEPRTPTESTLSLIWSEVLGLEKVGTRDNFFELGGNSLTTIQMVYKIRETFGVDVPLRTLFQAPSIEQLATTVDDQLLEAVDDEELGRLLAEVEASA
jgi:acyl carrier protein